MTLPPALSQNSLPYALNTVQNLAAQAKNQANSAVSNLTTNNVSTQFIFNLLDALNGLISGLNAVKNTTGLDAYATSNVPGYTGTMSADITSTINAAQACIAWVTTNFPKDNTATWLLSEQLNADGSRTLRTFTPAQTTGLQTNLNALLATIG